MKDCIKGKKQELFKSMTLLLLATIISLCQGYNFLYCDKSPILLSSVVKDLQGDSLYKLQLSSNDINCTSFMNCYTLTRHNLADQTSEIIGNYEIPETPNMLKVRMDYSTIPKFAVFGQSKLYVFDSFLLTFSDSFNSTTDRNKLFIFGSPDIIYSVSNNILYYINLLNDQQHVYDLTNLNCSSISFRVLVFLACHNPSSNAYQIHHLFENLTIISKLTYNVSSRTPVQIKYYRYYSNILLLVNGNSVEIWNVLTRILTKNATICSLGVDDIHDAIICNNTIFVVEKTRIVIYNFTNFSQFTVLPRNTSQLYEGELTCSDNNREIRYFVSNNGQQYLKIWQFASCPQNTTVTTNSSNSSNANFMKNIIQYAKQIIKNTDNESKVLGSVSSLTSLSIILLPILRPFINFLDYLWLYGFHFQPYPEFVQILTKQFDILIQLRIKPEILNYQIEVSQFQNQNLKLNLIQIIQPQGPLQKFFLQSTKNIYTTSLGISVTLVIILKFLHFMTSPIKNNCKLFKMLHHYCSQNSLWWVFLMSFIEANMVPIIFYCCIQFNLFVFFNPFSKANIIFALFCFLALFMYMFTFYIILFRYGKKNSVQKVTELSKQRNHNNYLLQCSTKCMRSFSIALIHGLFINYQLFQLIGLLAFDILFIFSLFFLRKVFLYKINFYLLVLFFIFFLVFDATLLSYYFDISNNFPLSDQRLANYNFVLIIVSFLQILVVALRILANIIIIIMEAVKKRIKQNSISDYQIKTKKKKKQKQVAYNLKQVKTEEKIFKQNKEINKLAHSEDKVRKGEQSKQRQAVVVEKIEESTEGANQRNIKFNKSQTKLKQKTSNKTK